MTAIFKPVSLSQIDEIINKVTANENIGKGIKVFVNAYNLDLPINSYPVPVQDAAMKETIQTYSNLGGFSSSLGQDTFVNMYSHYFKYKFNKREYVFFIQNGLVDVFTKGIQLGTNAKLYIVFGLHNGFSNTVYCFINEFKTAREVAVSDAVERGLKASSEGNHDRAVGAYTEALRLDSNNVAAYFYRGLAYYDKGDYNRAIADYETVLRLDPNSAAAYLNRGNAYANKGDYNRAIADWETVLRLDPDNANARRNIELIRQQRGK